MRNLAVLALLALAPLGCAACASLTIRACVENQPFMPLTNTDANLPGDGQILIEMAAAAVGATIHYRSASWEQCQQLVDSGEVDALVAASHAAINASIARFPMADDEADPARSMGAVRTDLFRRIGSDVHVRKGRLVNLKKRVGVMHAYQANSISVGRLGGTVDDNSRTMESLAKRLVAGQLDLVAGTSELRRLCAGPFAGKIERLPEPLDEDHYYFAFSNPFYAANQARAEAFWEAMAHIRQAPEYRARLAAEADRRNAANGSDDCPIAH